MINAPESSSYFSLHMPQIWQAGVFFSSPHSGHSYPQEFLDKTVLPLNLLRQSEDMAINRLFEGVIELGMPMLEAHLPRSYLDLNREINELDPHLFRDFLPAHLKNITARVINGFGIIPKKAGLGHEIYGSKLEIAEGFMRIERFYTPYHAALQALILKSKHLFGESLLIDCHSMPSKASEAAAADIILGDRFGVSCAPRIINFIEDYLQKRGFRVARNRPYAGGFITEHYGKPFQKSHALQIEINKGLYMDEGNFTLLPDFTALQHEMSAMAENLRDYLRPQDMRMAAE